MFNFRKPNNLINILSLDIFKSGWGAVCKPLRHPLLPLSRLSTLPPWLPATWSTCTGVSSAGLLDTVLTPFHTKTFCPCSCSSLICFLICRDAALVPWLDTMASHYQASDVSSFLTILLLLRWQIHVLFKE